MVQLDIIGINFLYAIGGVLLMYASYRAIDRLIPEVEFNAELKAGNTAVAIFVGALFVAIAIIIAGALN